MIIKKIINSSLLQIFKLMPVRIKQALAYRISDTLTNHHIFDLEVIQGTNPEAEYMRTYRASLSKAGDEKTDNIYKILRHLNLYSYIEDVLRREIPGDFAECGCWNGNSLFATKSFIDKHKSNKSIHVFDSFEGGLSEFKEKDFKDGAINSTDQADEVSKHFSSSYPELIKKTEELSRIYINKGWIPDVFKTQEERSYSFVHIDVDLYEPTIESYKYFFERLSKGGVMICDDYGYKHFPGASVAVNEFIESLENSSYSHFIKHSIGTCVIIK